MIYSIYVNLNVNVKSGKNVYLKITAHIDLSVTHAINWHQRDILKDDRFRQKCFGECEKITTIKR